MLAKLPQQFLRAMKMHQEMTKLQNYLKLLVLKRKTYSILEKRQAERKTTGGSLKEQLTRLAGQTTNGFIQQILMRVQKIVRQRAIADIMLRLAMMFICNIRNLKKAMCHLKTKTLTRALVLTGF